MGKRKPPGRQVCFRQAWRISFLLVYWLDSVGPWNIECASEATSIYEELASFCLSHWRGGSLSPARPARRTGCRIELLFRHFHRARARKRAEQLLF